MRQKLEYAKTELFECQCTSDNHVFKFTLDEYSGDIEELELWLSVYLFQYRPWWTRVWVALKYVFGCNCDYGHWDTCQVRDCDVDRLMALLQKYKEVQSKFSH